MSETIPTITLLGKTYPVTAPRSFTLCEDLVTVWNHAAKTKTASDARRVFAACIAICLPQIGAPHPDHIEQAYSGNIFAYGRDCYDHLRGKGATFEDVAAAARVCFNVTAQHLFPRKDEVEGAEDFSEGEGQQTEQH